MTWDLRSSPEQWAVILKSRVLKYMSIIKYHIFSSIWSTVKTEWFNINHHYAWILDKVFNINVCLDSWCGSPLVLNTSVEFLQQHDISTSSLVFDFIYNRSWLLPGFGQTFSLSAKA
ncbi:uncharacterized protein LOC131652281 [Vicia villosa]|uniref:uncharacterized protein LOC131652281 n=1 Tax=Vicia villosa TaxID=3911 RepID=UPI00273C9DFB|nr:uncharacterized protein LOC131652281 [Vicia villosa]